MALTQPKNAETRIVPQTRVATSMFFVVKTKSSTIRYQIDEFYFTKRVTGEKNKNELILSMF